jgi:hypothetical protein
LQVGVMDPRCNNLDIVRRINSPTQLSVVGSSRLEICSLP